MHVLPCFPAGLSLEALTDKLITKREERVIEKAAGCENESEMRAGGRLLSLTLSWRGAN